MAKPAPDVSDLFAWEDGLPRPRWDAVAERLSSLVDPGGHPDAWVAVCRQWLDALGVAMGGGYDRTETENFLILAPREQGTGDRLGRLAERCRWTLLDRLPGVAALDSPGKQVVVALRDVETFYHYSAHFFPEGERGGMLGVHIRVGYPHAAVYGMFMDTVENTVAHELTHAALHHLSMPLWLEEGLAQVVEHDVTGRSHLHIDAKTGERQKRYWGPRGLDEFWGGTGFSNMDKAQPLCYQLAEILVRLLMEESRPRWFGWVREPHRRFMAFLRAAKMEDCGESAYRDCVGGELANLAAKFLGPGPWAPSPDAPTADAIPLASTLS